MLNIASRLRPRTLNQALASLLAAVIVPLLLGALALLVVQARQERRLAQDQLAILAQTLVQAVDRQLGNARVQLEVLAASPMVDAEDWAQFHAYASDVARSTPGNVIGLVGSDGQQMFNTVLPWGAQHPNLWALAQQHKEVQWEGRSIPLSSQRLTKDVFATGKAVYSDLYFGLYIKRPALAISVPIMREGKVRYALTLSFPPAVLEELISAAVHSPGPRVAVVDRRGVVVASNASARSQVGDTITAISGKLDAAGGVYETTSKDGSPVRGAYAQSAANGFLVRVALPHEAAFSFPRSASAGWLALVLSALVASLILSGFLSRRISRPLRELGRAARSGRMPPPSTGGIREIEVLANALRAGARAEQQRSEALIVSVQREQEEAALRRADRQKDEFLATLAHELRNPLAPIRSAVELIRRVAPSDVKIQRARDVIERQVVHLSRLVDDLMDVSRITLGNVRLQRETLDVVTVAAGAVESIRSSAEAAGVLLEERLPNTKIAVSADSTRLLQCIVNLLNNAVKFTPAGGTVTLSVLAGGSRVRIEVSDTGVGISPASLDRIFEPFFQERPTGSNGNTGLGIGLALTRKLIELHGGTIHVESAGPGQGSRFRIELPAVADEEIAPGVDAPPVADGEGIRVLVVDDNRDAADTLSEMLTMMGFSTGAAYAGLDAVRAVQEQSPQVVLLDIGLPDIDGYEVCRRIKHESGDRAPVVIALTGWGQKQDLERAQIHGFDAHLTKPAEPSKVVALINSLLQTRT